MAASKDNNESEPVSDPMIGDVSTAATDHDVEESTLQAQSSVSDTINVEASFDASEPATSTVAFPLDPTLSHDVSSNLHDSSTTSLDTGFSPFASSRASLLNISPFEWYDLLAQDAISQIQQQASHTSGENRCVFDGNALSRRQSPVPFAQHATDHGTHESPHDSRSVTEPWNTVHNIALSEDDRGYLKYYIDVVGPILDLFDPDAHFTNVVPHLAIRNVGLLKSILAVAARHMSLSSRYAISKLAKERNGTLAADHPSLQMEESEHAHMAAQYYYETLQYLSQNLLYPSYAESLEVLATAIMISSYEMFDPNGSSTNSGDWERHLRGAFWIQRSQDNDGESLDGLRRAVWWAWLRQDTWAAFRLGRPTLTIWRPKKRLDELTSNELATRILYIAAKCVEYAAGNDSTSQDISQRIDQGNRLLQVLADWYNALPPSYRPLDAGAQPGSPASAACASSVGTPGPQARQSSAPGQSSSSHTFQPIWMHPRNHAGAIQMYHFARASVLLSQPTEGGLSAYRRRQRTLTESLQVVCGITKACDRSDHAMAFVNVQAVFSSKYKA